jgi:hypothetical protein
MEEKHYQFERPISEIRYNFRSISQDKEVAKRVIFTTSDYQNIYNLALVDVLEDGTLSDITESRNKDMITILATVIKIIEDFLDKHPEKFLIFQGSDERRQRLYRLVISRELNNLQKHFSIFGGIEGNKAEPFRPNKAYDYFLILKN